MKPIDLLVSEHRLIERVIRMLEQERNSMLSTRRTDIILTDRGVEFFESYALKTHQEKEEKFLFDVLERHPMSGEERSLMDELKEDHLFLQETVEALARARDAYLHTEKGTTELILVQLDELIGFYPVHFKKEEEQLFPLVEARLTDDEERELLDQFHRHDKERIHTMFKAIVSRLESERIR